MTIASLTELAPLAPSRGHAVGRYRVRILGNAQAANVWHAHAALYPPGSVLVAAHVEASDGAAGPALVMRKRAPGYFPDGGDWSYGFDDAALDPLRQGRLADCATCHALAPSGWVFATDPAR